MALLDCAIAASSARLNSLGGCCACCCVAICLCFLSENLKFETLQLTTWVGHDKGDEIMIGTLQADCRVTDSRKRQRLKGGVGSEERSMSNVLNGLSAALVACSALRRAH